MRKGKASYFYAGATTAQGFRSYFRENLEGLDLVFILKGGPGCGKSTLIRRVGELMNQQGRDVEYWQCSADPASLDGVVIPSLQTAVVDGTAPHAVEPFCPGAVEELVDLGAFWNPTLLRRQQQHIKELNRELAAHYRELSETLREAAESLADSAQELSAEDHVEAAEADQKENLLQEVFGQFQGFRRPRFATALTPDSWISFLQPLFHAVARRFALVGPFGGGREELLAAIANEAETRQLGAELYYHPLAPERLQMVIIPALNTAIAAFDEPPESMPDVTVVDCGRARDTEAARAKRAEAQKIAASGCEQVRAALALHDQLEACYIPTVDFSGVDGAGAHLITRILAKGGE